MVVFPLAKLTPLPAPELLPVIVPLIEGELLAENCTPLPMPETLLLEPLTLPTIFWLLAPLELNTTPLPESDTPTIWLVTVLFPPENNTPLPLPLLVPLMLGADRVLFPAAKSIALPDAACAFTELAAMVFPPASCNPSPPTALPLSAKVPLLLKVELAITVPLLLPVLAPPPIEKLPPDWLLRIKVPLISDEPAVPLIVLPNKFNVPFCALVALVLLNCRPTLVVELPMTFITPLRALVKLV